MLTSSSLGSGWGSSCGGTGWGSCAASGRASGHGCGCGERASAAESGCCDAWESARGLGLGLSHRGHSLLPLLPRLHHHTCLHHHHHRCLLHIRHHLLGCLQFVIPHAIHIPVKYGDTTAKGKTKQKQLLIPELLHVLKYTMQQNAGNVQYSLMQCASLYLVGQP